LPSSSSQLLNHSDAKPVALRALPLRNRAPLNMFSHPPERRRMQ
jgi:hypothetical protein